MRDVLDQQVERLSKLELELLIWLAIEREPISAQALWQNLVKPPSKRTFMEAQRSLRRCSLLQKRASIARDEESDVENDAEKEAEKPEEGAAPLLSLQNVVIEYLTDHLIESICQELERGNLDYFASHALIKAQSKEDVRESQVRVILQPIAERLVSTFGQEGAENRLRDLLGSLRMTPLRQHSSAGGTILKLLVQLKHELCGWDFSGLSVRQAYLRSVKVQGVNFSQADLAHTLFTDTFVDILSLAFNHEGSQLAVAAGAEIRLWLLPELRLLWLGREQSGDWVASI
jgi:hypothetical protein